MFFMGLPGTSSI